MLHISFSSFVNNLYNNLQYFVDTEILYSYCKNKSKVNSFSMCYKNKAAIGQKIYR